MLGDALIHPKSRDGWLKTVGIGGILLVTSVLVIPFFVLLGYLVRVIRSGSDSGSQPPVFEEWLDLFIDGLILFGIRVVYGIVGFAIPAVVVVFATPELLEVLITEETMATLRLSTGEIAVLLLAYLFSFLASYISLAAIARFAHEDRFEAAFEMRAIYRTAFTSEFFVAGTLSLSVGLALGVISILFFLSVVLFLGLISSLIFLVALGLFPFFYTYVVAYYLIGRGYKRVHACQEHTNTSLI